MTLDNQKKKLDFINVMTYSMSMDMTYIKFRAKVSKEGSRLVIVIPKALHEMISSYRGKDLLVELKETENLPLE